MCEWWDQTTRCEGGRNNSLSLCIGVRSTRARFETEPRWKSGKLSLTEWLYRTLLLGFLRTTFCMPFISDTCLLLRNVISRPKAGIGNLHQTTLLALDSGFISPQDWSQLSCIKSLEAWCFSLLKWTKQSLKLTFSPWTATCFFSGRWHQSIPCQGNRTPRQ